MRRNKIYNDILKYWSNQASKYNVNLCITTRDIWLREMEAFLLEIQLKLYPRITSARGYTIEQF